MDKQEVILAIEPSIAFGEPTLILPSGVAELKDFEQLILEKRLLAAHIIAALYMARSFLEAHE
jgi:hypothetical protein